MATSMAAAGFVYADGNKPHPKCKRGYVLNDMHRSVKVM
jgi:hypothetical protein